MIFGEKFWNAVNFQLVLTQPGKEVFAPSLRGRMQIIEDSRHIVKFSAVGDLMSDDAFGHRAKLTCSATNCS
jgi:hypothetical protein